MSARTSSISTNVRKHRIDPETGRVLFAAVAVWTTVMASAAVEHVADKFGDGALEMFGISVALFAAASYRIDDELRAFGRRMALPTLAFFAVSGIVGAIAAVAVHAITLAVFAAPLAALALAACVDRGFPRRDARKASAKSPGARPAAT